MSALAFTGTLIAGLVLGRLGPVAKVMGYFGRRRVERSGERELRTEIKELLEINAELAKQGATVEHLRALRREIESLRARAQAKTAPQADAFRKCVEVIEELEATLWWWIAYQSAREALLGSVALQLDELLRALILGMAARLRASGSEDLADEYVRLSDRWRGLHPDWRDEPAAVFHDVLARLETMPKPRNFDSALLLELARMVPAPPDSSPHVDALRRN